MAKSKTQTTATWHAWAGWARHFFAESEIIIIIQPSTPGIALASSSSSKFQTLVYVNKQQNESWEVALNKTKRKVGKSLPAALKEWKIWIEKINNYPLGQDALGSWFFVCAGVFSVPFSRSFFRLLCLPRAHVDLFFAC